MTHKLGMHWLRYHQDKHDLEHIERMQYPSIKPFQWMWNNAGFCADLLTVLPGDSYILARDHPLSEQKAEMWADPKGTGQRHADEWAEKVRSRQYHLPVDRTFFLGINEPDATNGDRGAIDTYNVSYLTRLQQHGLRGGAFGFSTGHPRTVDGTPNTPADYSVFESSHAAIVRGHHIAVAHIYGTTAVPLAPGHYDRLTACNWTDVQWVIGEFGIDEYVIGGGEHVGFHGGYEGRLDEYCRWLDYAIMGIEAIFPFIHSYQVFTFDFSHPWDTFDVRTIREALEAYQWQHGEGGTVTEPDDKPYETNLPFVLNGKSEPVAIVDAPAGANIRSGPGLEFPILGAEPYGEAMKIIGRNSEGDWWQVDMPHAQGWVYGMVVKVQNTANVPVVKVDALPPVPQPAGDNWQRSRDFVRRWEGGFQDYDWDAGNWTGCEVGKGEKKGTNRGVSACAYPHLDIRGLTQEQADEIHFRDRWVASGADQQPWPMCLLVYNAAVNFHPVTARKWLAESGGNPLHYVALYLRGYLNSDAWPHAHDAWVKRVIDVAMEATK